MSAQDKFFSPSEKAWGATIILINEIILSEKQLSTQNNLFWVETGYLKLWRIGEDLTLSYFKFNLYE